MSYPIPPLHLKLLMVRHGQTDGNSGGQFVGHKDIPLNKIGMRQVEAVAYRLSNERPAVIYSSDLQRAWQTALAIQQAIQQSVSPDPAPPLIADSRLREMCFGEWEGLTYSEIEAAYPEQLKAWQTNIYHCSPPGGESLKELGGRVNDFLSDILHDHAGESVIIAAHGGTFEALTLKVLKLESGRSWQFQISNTGISEFKFYPAGPMLTLWNDTCHLKQL
jgi:broad specificity phosphatase PhoE